MDVCYKTKALTGSEIVHLCIAAYRPTLGLSSENRKATTC